MTQPGPQPDAPARVQDRVSEPAEPISPIPQKDVTEAVGGIAALNRNVEQGKDFNLEDPKTWGSPFAGANSEFARLMAGTTAAESTVGKQVGQIDAKSGQRITAADAPDKKASTAPDAALRKVDDKTAVTDSTKQPDLTKEGVLKDYSDTLIKAGFSEADARRISDNTYARLQKDAQEGHLQGTPEEQMRRMDTAHREILDKPPGGKLKDGQTDYLSAADRQNIVKDSALRTENPDKYVNQGQHMTCALHSMGKQELEAGDPAKVAERTRDLVNNGFTTAKEQDRRGPNGEVIPGKERVVQVDSLSLKPDFEASRTVNSQNYGDSGKQGPAGQVYAAFAGQLAADLKSEREGGVTSASGIDKASNVYMAAHASERGARSSQTSTNEGVFSRDAKGNLTYEGDGPQVGIWDVAHLNRAAGGADGAVFASSSLFRDGRGDTPPAGYPPDLKISTFRNTDELRTKLGEFQRETGQSGQIGVNAPFLPGGGRNGHGMHAMNISLNADGSFKLDNNWGAKNDIGRVSDRDVDIATNKEHWNVPGGGGGRAPDDGTRFGPSTGQNPNETEKDFKDRQEQEKSKKEEEERLKEQEKREQEKREQEKLREGQLQLEKLEKEANLKYIKDMFAYEQASERARSMGVANTMPRPTLTHV